MKTINGLIERLPEIGGASGGGLASITLITWESVLAMVISALIFTFIGGIVGYFVKVGLDKLLRRNK